MKNEICCNCTDEEIAKSFIEDVEAVKDQLEGQPCDDTISRQATIDEISRILDDHPLDGYEDGQLILKTIQDMPPVTPVEKTGKCKWIKYDYRTICPKGHDADSPYWRIPENSKETLRYCPYCGLEVEIDGEVEE